MSSALIVRKRELVPKIFEYIVNSPEIAKKALPGHFVIVMASEEGERVPLTIADSNASDGTLTLVMMVVGTSTAKISRLNEGNNFYALLGPLGKPSEIENYGHVILVAGGVGAAPIYPIAKKLKEVGNRVTTIHGARTKELLFWKDKLREVSDEYIVTTDDGSEGIKGVVTVVLKKLLDEHKDIGCVYAIGPVVMMKYSAETTRPYKVKTIVSLNTIMIDGTGMCGGCRVSLSGKTKFTCSDGPEFDGHEVDWDTALFRSKIYEKEEKCSLEKYLNEVNKK